MSKQQTTSADKQVRQAVSMVEDGIVTIQDIEAADDSPLTDADLREQVEERLEADEPDDEETDESVGQAKNAHEIDWVALFEEFGFDTPNGNGRALAHPTQLAGALDTTEQQVAGDPDGHITDAVTAGYIDEVTVAMDGGGTGTLGYRLGGEAR